MTNLNGIIRRTKVLTLFLLLGFMLGSYSTMASAKQTLLIVGDSLGAGYGVPQEQAWATLLNGRFQQQALPYRVVNASISGDTTAGGLSRLNALLKRQQPTWVMIELGGNDGLRGMSLKSMQHNLETMVDQVVASGASPILVGIKIPPNYGKKYTQRFEQVFVTVAQQKQVPFLPFLLEGVAGWDQYMQDDRIHPNEKAQPIIEELVWGFLEPILTQHEQAPEQ